jgi:hypothetical protein
MIRCIHRQITNQGSELLGFWNVTIVRNSKYVLENTTFWKLDLFLSSVEGRETPTLLGPLGRANLNHWSLALHWRLALSKGPNKVSSSTLFETETDPVSETLYFLVFRILNDRQSPETQ